MNEETTVTPPRTIRFRHDSDPSRVASRDETRWVLNHVLIEDRHAIATDGRMLVCMKVEDTWGDVPKEWSPKPILIPRETVAAGCRNRTNTPEANKLEFRGDTAVIEFIHPQGERTYKQSDADPGNFPNWRQVIPWKTQGRITVAFDARYLMRIAKALNRHKRQLFIHLDPDDLEAPAFVTMPGNHDAFAILMPIVRGDRRGEPFDTDAILSGNHALQHALTK